MNYSTAIFLINQHARAIRCSYQPGEKDTSTTYVFKTFDQTIKEGDHVIVPTGTRHNLTVVKVEEVDVDFDIDMPHEMKWVVGKVDIAAHEIVLEQERQAIKTIKSAELRKKRSDLAVNLLADAQAELQNLPIANIGAPAIAAPATPADPNQ